MLFNEYHHAVMKMEKYALWKAWQIVNSRAWAGTQVSAMCINYVILSESLNPLFNI